jgi:hypothetical protein
MGEGDSPPSLVVFLEKEELSLSWPHTLARGWPIVKMPRTTVPMVGWKMTHPSTITTLFTF